jgi:hypothetical protein
MLYGSAAGAAAGAAIARDAMMRGNVRRMWERRMVPLGLRSGGGVILTLKGEKDIWRLEWTNRRFDGRNGSNWKTRVAEY